MRISAVNIFPWAAALAVALFPVFVPAGEAQPDKPLQFSAGDSLDDLGPRPAAKPAAASSLPRGADGKPDLTGIWFAGIRDFVTLDDRRIEIPLTPDYAAARARRVQAMDEGKPLPDYVSTCQAFGMPRIMSYGVMEFVHRPQQLWVISEVMHEVRRIYLDGKPHGDWQESTFGGISTGRWEGDTLVVDTRKLRPGFMSMTGIPYSDHMVVNERIRMVNRDAIENEMTLTDPVALTKPWKVVQRYGRMEAGYEIGEYICNEYNVSGGSPADVDPHKDLPASALSSGAP